MKDRNTNDIRLCPARLTVRQTLSILALVAAISLAALLFGCGDLEPLVEKDTASLEDLVLDPEVPDISYGSSRRVDDLPPGELFPFLLRLRLRLD